MSARRMSVLRGLLIVLALAGASYAMGRPGQAASQVSAIPVPCAGPMDFSAPPGTPTPAVPFPRTVHLGPPLMSFPSTLGTVQVDQRTGRLYALSLPSDRYALGCGTLWMLDARTGSVVADMSVPSPAGAAGLDDLDGKLLIPVRNVPALNAPESILDLYVQTHQVLRSPQLGQVGQILLVPKAHRAILQTSSAVCLSCPSSLQILAVATGKVSPFAQLPYLGGAVADWPHPAPPRPCGFPSPPSGLTWHSLTRREQLRKDPLHCVPGIAAG